MTMISTHQTLKARYDEARQIKDAWHVRLQAAQQAHTEAVLNGGDTEATRRNINAVEINFNDAAAELSVAIDAWMDAVHHSEKRYHR